MLNNVEEGKEFRSRNGENYRNLYELAKALNTMDNDTFSFHVNNDKNDFASWVLDVMKNDELSKTMEGAKTKEEAQLVLLREAALLLVDKQDSVLELGKAIKGLL